MNKKHIQAAIESLKKIENDALIADIVRKLEAHAEELDDDSEAADSHGGNHPGGPGGKP